MTDAPEPAELAAPDLPRDPAQYAAHRPRLPLSFWLIIAFGLVCVLAGVAVGRFGARLFPVKPAVESTAPAQASAADSAPNSAYAPPPPLTATPSGASITAAEPAGPTPAAVAALNGRIDQLVQSQHRSASAAGAALAASELGEAAQSSRPFADQLAALDPILPDSSALRTLRPLAAQQTPSRAALAADFAVEADHVAVASRAPPKGSGLIKRLLHTLTAVLTIRRVDKLTGDSPDAVLARAQRQVDDGDLEDALTTLNDLPPAGREAIAAWRARAARRVMIDRLIAAIRQGAAQDLAEASGHG
jgi:hypothetical protein